MMKTVQVLLSTYNGEKYLPEQISSLLKQKGVHVEILARDDGSTDHTKEILHQYQNQLDNLHVLEGENLGFAQSFWVLVRAAGNADYYAFCDQDDIWKKDKLFSAVSLLEQEGQMPLLYTSNVIAVDENRKVLKEQGFPDSGVLSYADSLRRSILPGCTFVFNQKLLDYMKQYKDRMIAHDWTAYLIAESVGKVLYDETPHILYRLHENNAIGMESRTAHWKKKVKRLFAPDFPNSRSCVAEHVYEICSRDMEEEKKQLLYRFAHNTEKLQYRLELLHEPEYRHLSFLFMLLLKRV